MNVGYAQSEKLSSFAKNKIEKEKKIKEEMKKYENRDFNKRNISNNFSNFNNNNPNYSSERINKNILNNLLYDNIQNKKTENKIINNKINDTNSQIEEITKMNKTSKNKNEEKTEKETEYEKEQNKYKTEPITQISKYEKPSTPKLKYNLPEYKQKSIIENKTGLENLGNTCFMNTCLQLLIHCPPFIDRLIEISPNSKLSGEFYKLCKNQSYSNKATYPKEIKIQFAKNHREYNGYQQHDTQEFCRLFLEDLSKELNKVYSRPSYKELDDNGKSKEELNKEYDLLFKRREDSIIIDTFYGQLINIFKCECGFESYSFEKVLDLPLLFNEYERIQKLDKLLDKYFESDYLEWGSKCQKCKKIEDHLKEVKIAYPPEILILSLQRINERTGRKNTSIVEFKEEIDLIKYFDISCTKNYSSKYKLISTGNHAGSMEFGHYTANVNILGNWYEFNDERCNKCISFKNSSSSVYVLMFQRLE